MEHLKNRITKFTNKNTLTGETERASKNLFCIVWTQNSGEKKIIFRIEFLEILLHINFPVENYKASIF